MGGSRRARRRVVRVTATFAVAFLLSALWGVAHAALPVGGFLNPDTDGPFNVISDTPDGTDSTYHFVLRADPADVGQTITTVEIQTEDADADLVWETIGTATKAGSSDAWEFKWDMTTYPFPGDIDNDDGFVRAQVFDSGGDASHIPDAAGIPVRFRGDFVGAPGAETVEIVSPANPANLGFYDGPDPDGEMEALIIGTGSVGITNAGEVDLFYSTSAASDPDPDWTFCGEAVTTIAAPWRGVCELEPAIGVTPDVVTAVAARADDDDDDAPGSGIESGDAHRVSGYAQTPAGATVELSPQSTSAVIGFCPTLTAVVRDSRGNLIYGANVDVHATGPVDEQVQFAWNMDDPQITGDQVSDNGPDTHAPGVPPGSGHETFESMAECDGTVSSDGTFTETPDADGEPADNNQGENASDGTPGPNERGTQGRHIATGADPKHLEGFTDADGFQFSLDSPSTGTTNVVAWFDIERPDDEVPTGEPSASASVTWLPKPVPPPPPPPTCANASAPAPIGNPTGDETGPVSAPVHGLEPTTGPLGPTVHEVNCDVVVRVEDLLGQ